jgi:signal peptidase I
VLLKLLKVTGYSLYPVYQDGDYVIVSNVPLWLRRVRPGDAVVFEYPHLGTLIKFVDHLEEDGRFFHVIGLDADSVDSRFIGPIPRSKVLGKVIRHIPRK